MMFLWCHLPDNNSAIELANRCLSQGMVLAPRNAFSQSKNVAQATDSRMFEVLAQALV